ncbi:MAG TPA: glycosyltransferase [Xanthobacteraceae bacterium]|nr:glycosyltransferase [Xanthobacteraceae bacterium]
MNAVEPFTAERAGVKGRPIRLLVTAVGYPSDQLVAGTFHQDQFRLIAEAGFDVTVVVPTPWVPRPLSGIHRWRKYVAAPERQTDGPITILRPRYLTVPRENAWFVPDLSQYLAVRRLDLPRPDLVHGFHVLPLGAVAARLARRWRVPYLTTAMGDDVNVYPHLRRRNLRLLKDVVSEAAVTFATGETLARATERLTGCRAENLPIGVSATRFRNLPSREAARARLNLPHDRIIVLYVGRMVPGKGIDELAAALDDLRDLSMLCVAIGEGPCRSTLEAKSNALCLGARSPSEVDLAMAAADVFVLPSHSEGLPTVLVEAALANLAIVTTDAPGCIDLAADGRALVVPVGDAPALARALRQAAADPDVGRKRACAMRAHVEAFCTLEINTARLIEHYRRVLENAAGWAGP